MRLDVELLKEKAACNEGLRWMAALSPDAIDLHQGMDQLDALGDPGFVAWAFFHLTEAREAAPEAWLAKHFGPRHQELAALFDGLRGSTFYGGPCRLDELSLSLAVQRHLQALYRFGLSGLSSPVPLTRVNSLDAWALVPREPERAGAVLPPAEWIAGWFADFERVVNTAGSAKPLAKGAGTQPVRASLQKWLADELRPIATLADWVARFVGAAAFKAAFRGARETVGTGAGGAFVISQAVADAARADAAAQALWLLADVEAPSPFDPLLTLWRANTWPVGLVEGVFILGVTEKP